MEDDFINRISSSSLSDQSCSSFDFGIGYFRTTKHFQRHQVLNNILSALNTVQKYRTISAVRSFYRYFRTPKYIQLYIKLPLYSNTVRATRNTICTDIKLQKYFQWITHNACDNLPAYAYSTVCSIWIICNTDYLCSSFKYWNIELLEGCEPLSKRLRHYFPSGFIIPHSFPWFIWTIWNEFAPCGKCAIFV